MKKEKLKRMGAGVLSLVMALSLMTGCGKEKKDALDSQGNPGNGTYIDSELVYTAEAYELPDSEDEETYTNFIALKGDMVYLAENKYSEEKSETRVYSYNYLTKEKAEKNLDFTVDGVENTYAGNISHFEDDTFVAVIQWDNAEEIKSEMDEIEINYLIRSYDANGNPRGEFDITDNVKNAGEEYNYISKILHDDKNVYVLLNSKILVFNHQGESIGTIDSGFEWILSMSLNRQHQLLVTGYTMSGTTEGKMFETEKLSEVGKISNYPYCLNSIGAIEHEDGKYYIPAEGKLVAYDPGDGSFTNILTWAECDVIQNQIFCFDVTKEGKFVLYLQDWEQDTAEIVVLSETDPSTIAEKEVITIGTLFELGSDLSNYVVNFNKSSDKYKIKIVTYAELSNLTEEQSVYDAIDNMNKAFVSDSCPDIIDISYANLPNLVEKGALLDMNDYLNNSKVVKKDDFIPSLLEAYTYSGTLCAVPQNFYINLLMGKKSLIGERDSWSMKEFMEFCSANPDASVFQYATQQSILYTMLSFGQDKFMDYNSMTCNFDNQDFIDILTFAKGFPEEFDYDDEFVPISELLSSGQVLLQETILMNVEDFVVSCQMFGEEVQPIGYPTPDGSPGFSFYVDGAYGVSAKTTHKEGVYEFLDYVMKQDSTTQYGINMCSSRKADFEKQLEDSMKKEYVLDENGETMLDEQGNPIEKELTSYFYDGIEVKVYAATQQDVDMIRSIVNRTNRITSVDYTLYSLIYEEAQAYFTGQKSAEDVAKVIQSRISLFISEQY